jgi:hypothetical protein
MSALNKYAAKNKKKSIPSLPYGARVPKSYTHKRKPGQRPPVLVPITDPNDGRIFSHRERERQQSLPKKFRGPSWKDTSHPAEMPGMPKGPSLKQPRDKDYWKGAPLTHPKSANVKQLNKQGSVMNALEKYAAKKKLTKKVLEKLYGKKPTEGKALRRLGIPLGMYGGINLGSLAGTASTRLGRKVLTESADGQLGLSKGDINKVLGTMVGGSLLGTGVGGKLGHMAGKSLDKRIFNKRLAKHTRRKVVTNVGLGAGGLAALAAASKKRKK